LDDLDDELSGTSSGDGSETDKKPGHWRSVRSLEMFWELMSFRQECSAGRLVGFLWLVVNPPGLLNSDKLVSQGAATVPADTKKKIQSEEDGIAPATTSAEAKFDDRSLSALQDEKPQPSTSISDAGRSAFYWPEIGRGEIILSEEDYKLANDVLLDQDFETEELAMKGTMAWIRKVASVADVLWWGIKVTGRKQVLETAQPAVPTQTIGSGLIVRKRKKEVEPATTNIEAEAEAAHTSNADKPVETSKGVNVLNANFVRKKKKT
jgi:regulator of Ty1 transposition protein 109